MPPKPQPRKPSISSKSDASVNSDKVAAMAMPPPPDPPPPARILEPEVNALSACLKNAAVKTGQVYAFYADTRKLGIAKHVPRPPRSLTASLGREIEKYDQLCDSIESHLLQAIAVLQRDLYRQEKRLKEAETASVASRTRSKSSSLSPTLTRAPLPPATESTASGDPVPHSMANSVFPTPTNSPPTASTSSLSGRRPSAISISSLHRPTFPLKLDLSSTALRMTAEEASLFSNGLASPVTLAPKSARPMGSNEFPPELMAAFASASSSDNGSRSVDIDLTVPDMDQDGRNDISMSMDANVGSSADKPIELDLDAMDAMDIEMANMSDLFGDSADNSSNDAGNVVDGLFSPVVGGPGTSAPSSIVVKTEKEEHDIFDALGVGQTSNDADMFASLDTDPSQITPRSFAKDEAGQSAPSPGTLLANFASPSHLNLGDHPSSNTLGSETPFDYAILSDLSPGFFANAPDTEMNFTAEMASLLSMEGGDEKADGDGVKPELV